MFVLFCRDTVDKADVSWTGPTRVSTESLPSKALSMNVGAVLSPVGDNEPLDRSISQPNIAGGLKLPAAVPPSPTVLASCSSTSSDLSRGGYASADSLGSLSSKEDTLSAPLTSEETQSVTTERSPNSVSPCPENVPSLSLTVDEQLIGSSLTGFLEPTPDLVLNLPTTVGTTAVNHTACPPLTSAEMFASAEHGTIKKSATPSRSSASGEDGISMDEVSLHTPVELMQALEGDTFNFDLLPAPPSASDVVIKSTDEECELPPDNLQKLSLGCESPSQETSSMMSVNLPSETAADRCTDVSTAVCASQLKPTSHQNTESLYDTSQVFSVTSTKNGDCSLEAKSNDLMANDSLETLVSKLNSVQTTCESAELASALELRIPSGEGSGLSEQVCSDGADVAASATEVQSHLVSSAAVIAQQSVNLYINHQEVVTSEQLPAQLRPVAVAGVLPVDDSSSAHDDGVITSVAPDLVHFTPVTSAVSSSDAQTDVTVQSTTSVSAVELQPESSMYPRPSSSPQYTTPSGAIAVQPHCSVKRRLSESAVPAFSPSSAVFPSPLQSATSRLMQPTSEQATSVAGTSFHEPLPHRPPPSLAAHSAALQLLSQKHEPSSAAAAGVTAAGERPETSARLESSPAERPKTKPPPVKKKPTGPFKEKFFSTFGDHHQQ